VDDHRLHADEAQEDQVLGELLLQARRGHRRAAVLEDHGRAPEAADVRHRLEQGLDRLLLAYRHEASRVGAARPPQVRRAGS
jgi:hypothetical protein